MKRIGFIGIGAMGSGMVKSLLRVGYTVKAHDVVKEAVESAVELGAAAVSSPKEASADSGVVITSLPSPEVVEEVILGSKGVLSALRKGSYIIDVSTTDPGTTKKIFGKAAEKGVAFLDAPVSGGPTAADKGTLTIMVGGNKAAFNSVKHVLEAMGENIYYIGESGTAQLLKLCHNILCASAAVAIGESFITGVKAGLDPKIMANVISKSIGRSGTLEVFGSMIANGDHDTPAFMLQHMHKDVELYVKTTRELGVPALTGNLVCLLYRSAMAKGKGKKNHTAVIQVVEELAGTFIGKERDTKTST